MKTKVVILAVILTSVFFIPVWARATPIYNQFENGVATIYWDVISFNMTATDEWGNTLQNDGAGTFFAKEGENYLVKAWPELPNEWDENCLSCLPDNFSFIFGKIYQDQNFLGGIDMITRTNIFDMSAEIGTQTYTLIGKIGICNFWELPITETAIDVTTAPVPEPATMFLFGIGLLGVAGMGRKRQKTTKN